MEMLMNIVLLVVGFVLLIKGADFFVEGASSIATKFHIPQIIIGLTIVAFGTSLPEAAISINAAFAGSAGITVGNVFGSNILNVLLILGVSSVIAVLEVKKDTVRIEMPFVIFISAVILCLGIFDGTLGRADGAILWVLFVVFFVYLIYSAKKNKTEEEEEKPKALWLSILFTVGGLAAIVFGSDLTVDSATVIAKSLGMTDRLIGLTIVAFGTSLPELITSATAAVRKKTDIAIGNIVGSNIFNILFVAGTSALICPVEFKKDFLFDGIMMIVSAILLFLCSFKKQRITRVGGVIMLIVYAGYFAALLIM